MMEEPAEFRSEPSSVYQIFPNNQKARRQSFLDAEEPSNFSKDSLMFASRPNPPHENPAPTLSIIYSFSSLEREPTSQNLQLDDNYQST